MVGSLDRTSRRFGLGARLAVVVALAMLPALVFLCLWVDGRREAALEEARQWTHATAEAAAERHAAFFREVRATLEMLAINPAVRSGDVAGCTELLRETQRRRPWMGDGWVVDDDGRAVCATNNSLAAPVIDTETEARMTHGGFALSDVLGAEDHSMHLAAMLVEAKGGHRRMVVESRLGLTGLANVAALPNERDGEMLIAVDRKGRAISYSGSRVDYTGKQIGDHPVIHALLAAAGRPVVGAVHDGIDQIFSAATVPEWGATIIVGIGSDTVLATSLRSLAVAAAIAFFILLLTSGIGWVSADRLIMRFVRVVRDAAVAMAGGAIGRRADVSGAPREIRQLADAFNRMTDHLERLALHDQLTGLPNRRYLGNRVAELEAAHTPFAVMVLDADDFKQINDRYGHAVGDVVLKTLGERLTVAVGGDGFCARVGGDEFIVMVTAGDEKSVRLRLFAVAERIRELMALPVGGEAQALTMTGSIGAAIRDGEVRDIVELFHNADRALYVAKAAGRNRMVVFDGSQPDIAGRGRDEFAGAQTVAA